MAISNGNGVNGNESHPHLSDPRLLHINGEDVPSSTNSTFPVKNPMTGKTIYECSSATESDYGRAIESAHSTFQSWSQTPPSARRLIFLKAADILETYLDPANSITAETLAAEVSATKAWVQINIKASIGLLRESAGLVTHIKGEIVPADRPGTTILVHREPVGVVFAISPWNAPVNLTARAIATPLICGNTVVLKPSEFSPKSQYILLQALYAAGLPAGCLHFLPTSPATAPAVTEYAIKHPLVRLINFTGSSRVGTVIAMHAASVLKRCVLELGGKAPAIVLADADLNEAVDAIVFGGLSNCGQICMSTERVIVDESIASEFSHALIERVNKVKSGNHEEEPDVSLSGLYNKASATRVLEMMQTAIADGAKLIKGDLKATGPNGTVIAPHILSNVTPKMNIYHEESFGPLLTITTFPSGSTAEAINLANESKYSLCSSIFTRDVMRAMAMAKKVRAGSVHINGPTVYIEATLPNGGTGGSSGYGRFGGIAGVEEFTERKIVSLKEGGGGGYPF